MILVDQQFPFQGQFFLTNQTHKENKMLVCILTWIQIKTFFSLSNLNNFQNKNSPGVQQGEIEQFFNFEMKTKLCRCSQKVKRDDKEKYISLFQA